ncbi:hypothetical protein M6D93_04120 [Jatrophihabitans telluris]|uniref:Uncharacterized protein n=1 Tax=Jatrophihabitans telluris TaxID=2038343 RepID=A0ABY4R040_9ACTN|nr:hypothetical protein [Jatrophihabitans telluris]UQX89195.1 hypothetical protein M6D93_04120 [Jatrophihabitans telluris]
MSRPARRWAGGTTLKLVFLPATGYLLIISLLRMNYDRKRRSARVRDSRG